MAKSELYNLRWKHFETNIAETFKEFWEDPALMDVTLAVEGQQIQAHRFVLSMSSPYFKQIFQGNFSQHPVIMLADVNHQTMKEILEYMYLGTVAISRSQLPQFLKAAFFLQVKGLSMNEDKPFVPPKLEISNNLITPPPENSPPLPTSPVAGPSGLSVVSKPSGLIVVSKALVSQASNVLQESTGKRSRENSFSESKKIKLLKSPQEKIVKTEPCSESEEEMEKSETEHHVVYEVDQYGNAFCPYCSKKFVNRYNLKIHVRDRHTETEPVECMFCGKMFRNESCLRVHKSQYHKKERNEYELSRRNTTF